MRSGLIRLLVPVLLVGALQASWTPAASAQSSLTVAQSFPGVDETTAGGGEPPDTQVAAGPNDVLEATNGFLGDYTRTGALRGVLNQYTVVGVKPGHSIFDPQVEYDSRSGRWFFLIDDDTDNTIDVAVSRNSDPMSGWTSDGISTDKHHCIDQPAFAVADRVIAVSDLEFPGTCRHRKRGRILTYAIVINKKRLISGRRLRHALDEQLLPGSRTGVPARTVSGEKNLYVLVNDAYHPTRFLQVKRYVGAPPNGHFQRVVRLKVPKLVPPREKGAHELGAPHPLDLGSGRLQSAFFYHDRIWVAGETSCPRAAPSSCVRLMEVNPSRRSLVSSENIGLPGLTLGYPAIATDGRCNVYAVYGETASSRYPSIGAIAYQPAVRQLSNPTTVTAGQAPLGLEEPRSSTYRWGDYSGASPDPADPNSVWVASEYGYQSSNWGTTIARLTLSGSTSSC